MGGWSEGRMDKEVNWRVGSSTSVHTKSSASPLLSPAAIHRILGFASVNSQAQIQVASAGTFLAQVVLDMDTTQNTFLPVPPQVRIGLSL